MFGDFLKQPDSDASNPRSEYAAALEEYSCLRGKLNACRTKLRGIEIARSMVVSPADRDRVSENLRAIAAPFEELARFRPMLLEAQREEIEDEIKKLTPLALAAGERRDAIARKLTNYIAGGLQDRHRRAVEHIASALEELSVALHEEADLQRELARQAPLPASAKLPDMHADMADADLSVRDSTAWRWVRRARQIGILD